ncbi:MAG: hypothetical protein PW845_18700 [Pseudomonas sp.]|uniref:hypothetical protein n=1 Tax=Pseudomonas abieticivorans TaxID=2931382 RepID=UPI0020C046A2|nr:hypothetical protein [Pseudomonas sp. PIA16]MDE1167345.1 hypothetical protein [Pseudomonas sp.]
MIRKTFTTLALASLLTTASLSAFAATGEGVNGGSTAVPPGADPRTQSADPGRQGGASMGDNNATGPVTGGNTSTNDNDASSGNQGAGGGTAGEGAGVGNGTQSGGSQGGGGASK